jgi:hypothetical protein
MIDRPAGGLGKRVVRRAVQLHSERLISRPRRGEGHRLLGAREHGSAIEKIGISAPDPSELPTEKPEGEIGVSCDRSEQNTGIELE